MLAHLGRTVTSTDWSFSSDFLIGLSKVAWISQNPAL